MIIENNKTTRIIYNLIQDKLFLIKELNYKDEVINSLNSEINEYERRLEKCQN